MANNGEDSYFFRNTAPDPATSPKSRKAQIAFGAAIAVVYMILMYLHVVFALFHALTIVCLVRGIGMAASCFVTTNGRGTSSAESLRQP